MSGGLADEGPAQPGDERAAARGRQQEVPLDALFDQAAEADSPPLAESLPRRLSPQDREVLLWRFEQGLDYDEIAERLGISETGCRSRVSRGCPAVPGAVG